MTKLEKAIKVVSDFVTIDGHSEKEEVLFSALQLVVDTARKQAAKK